MNFFKISLLLVFISLIVGLTPSFLKFAFNNNGQSADVIASKMPKSDAIKYVIARKSRIPVYLADTEEKRIKGLGERTSIPVDYGMFFIFDGSDYQSIWMKDMLFSIDIIWIDENFNIVHIEKNISPDTYPKIFTPPFKVRYVLELNSGMSDFYDLKTGEKAIFSQK
ncbi:MAG: DUF192 domain-containing protein [Patescibacteria group bacterium]|nr:DUF192 domain-containing protein [Patescibacteria group bacterium]MDE1988351.1 DUF192 domain-containing protein [Patescibacteria group bacterium]MDE2218515.1 DUF192 domain-containing protein [Patescibacteria group bacterium]